MRNATPTELRLTAMVLVLLGVTALVVVYLRLVFWQVLGQLMA